MRSKRTTGSYRYQRRRWPAAGTRDHHLFGRLALWLLVAAVGIGGLYMGHKILAQMDFFQVAAIEIQGCKRLSKAEVLELSGVDIHSNLVAIDGGNLQNRLEQDDWIELAEVTRKWPDRLIISIRERQPVAMVNLEGALQYIDKNGVVFASVKGADSLDYPVVSGLSNGEWPAELAASLEEALLFVRYVARHKNPNLPPQNISELMISADSIVLFLMDRPFPIRLGRGEIKKKYARLAKVLHRLYKRKEFNKVAYIQVDYTEDKVLVGSKRG
jgi:cell division protein FtsQ